MRFTIYRLILVLLIGGFGIALAQTPFDITTVNDTSRSPDRFIGTASNAQYPTTMINLAVPGGPMYPFDPYEYHAATCPTAWYDVPQNSGAHRETYLYQGNDEVVVEAVVTDGCPWFTFQVFINGSIRNSFQIFLQDYQDATVVDPDIVFVRDEHIVDVEEIEIFIIYQVDYVSGSEVYLENWKYEYNTSSIGLKGVERISSGQQTAKHPNIDASRHEMYNAPGGVVALTYQEGNQVYGFAQKAWDLALDMKNQAFRTQDIFEISHVTTGEGYKPDVAVSPSRSYPTDFISYVSFVYEFNENIHLVQVPYLNMIPGSGSAPQLTGYQHTNVTDQLGAAYVNPRIGAPQDAGYTSHEKECAIVAETTDQYPIVTLFDNYSQNSGTPPPSWRITHANYADWAQNPLLGCYGSVEAKPVVSYGSVEKVSVAWQWNSGRLCNFGKYTPYSLKTDIVTVSFDLSRSISAGNFRTPLNQDEYMLVSHRYADYKNIAPSLSGSGDIYQSLFGNNMLYAFITHTNQPPANSGWPGYEIGVKESDLNTQPYLRTKAPEVDSVGSGNEPTESTLLYPNPAKSELHIDLKHFEEEVMVEIAIYTTDGRQVKRIREQPVDSRIRLDLQSFKSGFYYLEMRTASNSFFKKFIVRK